MAASRAAAGVPTVTSADRSSPAVTVDGDLHPQGAACTRCGQRVYPAAVTCPACHTTSMVETSLAGAGVVYSHTRVHTGAGQPNVLVYVDLDDGVRLLGRMDQDASIGSRVQVGASDGDAITFRLEGVANG